MGGGASLEGGIGTERDQYYCHSCRRVFTSLYATPEDMTCPLCDSAFVEEVQGLRQHDIMPVRRGVGNGSQLTAEQARRFTSATTMLRLLETQLREELEHLQIEFEAGYVQNSNRMRNGTAKPPPKLSKIMIGKLRSCVLDLDLVCSQPSCPICSEDFVVEAEEAKLPCGHLYHRSCVMPWLESKQNCPICRTELTNDLPELSDLERLPMKDLNNWMEILTEESSSPICSGHKKIDNDSVSGGGAEVSAVPKDSPRLTVGDSKLADWDREEGKDDEGQSSKQEADDDEKTNNQSRTILAENLLKRLQAYEEWRAEAVRVAEEEQRSIDAARHAHLAALDNHMTNLLTFNTPGGRALLTAASGGAGPANAHQGNGNARSPGSGTTWRSRLISPAVAAAAESPDRRSALERSGSGESFLSPSRMAASLRQGLFPTSPLGRSHSSEAGGRGNFPTHAVTGITRLTDGTEVRHRIQILDDDSSSGDEEDSESSEADARLQALYRQANASHLSQYANANTASALSASSLGGSGYFMAPAFSGVGAGVGTALQRMGLHRTHSAAGPSGHLAPSQGHSHEDRRRVQRAFQRAMHPAEDDHINDTELDGDWGRALAQLEADLDSGSGPMRRSGFNGITDGGEHGIAEENVSRNPANAQQHAPTLASAISGTSGRYDRPSGGAENSNASMRDGVSSSQRVSAIERYMTLTAPELFGTSERSSNTLGTSTSGGANTSPGGSIGTTYQVRATGEGSYATVSVRVTAGSSGRDGDVA